MAVVIDGTTGISTPAEAVAGNLSYTGTLTGGTGVVNLGSGQVYKDASGNVGIGRVPNYKIDAYFSGTGSPAIASSNDNIVTVLQSVGNTQGNVGTLTSHPLVFLAGNTERARIDSSGNLSVGRTDLLGSAKLQVLTNASSLNAFSFQNSDNAGYGGYFYNASGGPAGSITWTATTTTYATSSDYRLKENVQPMADALAKISALKPCTYTWKEDGSAGEGFIAHELAEVVPDAVKGEKDAVNEDGSINPQGIDTSFLVATLAAAIQELKAVVDAQATRITALEGTA